jgi:hypothetical protein
MLCRGWLEARLKARVALRDAPRDARDLEREFRATFVGFSSSSSSDWRDRLRETVEYISNRFGIHSE